MAKKKKNTGQRNFFRVMAVIGFVTVFGLGYEFLQAAPRMTLGPHHQETTPVGECLRCHTRQIENTPIMPHRPMVGENVEQETEQVLKNLSAILQASGLTFDDVIKTTVYLADLADFAGGLQVSTTAGLQVHTFDLEEPDFAGAFRWLHRKRSDQVRLRLEFFVADPATADHMIFLDQCF